MSVCKTTSAGSRGLGWGLGVALFVSCFVSSLPARAALAPEDLEDRYRESLRKATQENDISGATNEVDGALTVFRTENPENPQLAALHLLRGVLLFAVDGDAAKADILNSFKAALRVHPWAQFEPSMRSEPLDALLEEARSELGQDPPSRGIAPGKTDPRCGEALSLYVAYSDELEIDSAEFHWRSAGETAFEAREMDRFAGVASLELAPHEHEDQDGEYFITLHDASGEQRASVGSASSPQSFGLDCPGAQRKEKTPPSGRKKDTRRRSRQRKTRKERLRRIGLRVSAGTGWGVSYGESERVYDVANPNKPGHYSLLATACAIARRAAPRGGALPSTAELYGKDASAPGQESIFGRVASSPQQAAQLASVYDEARCKQRHPINAGVAPSLFHLEPELSVRVSEKLELALFSRLQLIHGMNIQAPVQGAPLDEVKPAFERLELPMPWTVGLAARYRKQVARVKGLSWSVGGYAGYGRAALVVPMPFGHDRNGNSVADENEVSCSIAPGQAPVFPAMDGCTNPDASKQAIDELRALAKKGDQARDVLELGNIFAGVELGVEYLFTPMVGLSASGQIGVWFTGHRPSGLVDLKLGPSFHF